MWGKLFKSKDPPCCADDPSRSPPVPLGPPAATMEAEQKPAAQQTAYEALAAAQKSLSVESLIDFCALPQVSPEAQGVATAAVCMVAGIGDTVDAADSESALPPRTWDAARAVLSQPGHFISCARGFHGAVDGNRLPRTTVDGAVECMQGVTAEHMEGEPPVVQHLFRWVVAASCYCEAVGLDGSAEVGRGSLTNPAGPVAELTGDAGAPGNASALDAMPAPAPGPPSGGATAPSPEALPKGKAALAPEDPRRRGGTAQTPQPPRHTSTSGTTGGSSLGRSPLTSPSPATGPKPRRWSHSTGAPAGSTAAGTGALRHPHERLARVGPTPEPSRTSTRGAGTSGGQLQASVAPAHATVRALRAGGAGGATSGTGGYPQWARRGNEGLRERLERLRREAREVRAQEAQLRWGMRREEAHAQKLERKIDEQDIMSWRQKEQADSMAHQAQVNRAQREAHVQESKAFQEFKREVRAKSKELELQNVRDEYAEGKAHSEWQMETTKIAAAEWQKAAIEAGLEKVRFLSEHHLEEQRREDTMTVEARQAAIQAERDQAMAKARQEKESALKSLEHARAQQRVSVPQGWHLLAQPK